MNATDALWAKKNDTNGAFSWLSLPQHLKDTEGVAGLLWTHWLSPGQRLYLARALSDPSEEAAYRLIRFLGAVHDLGKATPSFQILQGFQYSPDLDRALLEKLEQVGFSGISSLDLPSRSRTPHALAGQVLLDCFGLKEDLACIVGAHHGQPLNDPIGCAHCRSYDNNYKQVTDPADPIHQLWTRTQKAILETALATNGYSSVDDLPRVTQPGQALLSGLLIMADWIASNESYFPLLPLVRTAADNQEDRLIAGWSKWIKSDLWTPQPLFDLTATYEDRFHFSPNPIQTGLADIIEGAEAPGLIILEAPMGIGKTEAALISAEQVAERTGRSGLFFALPTQATSNGIFPRIKDWLDHLAEEADQAVSLRLLHGKAALNPDFSALARQVNLDSEDEHILVNEWFSGRKTASLDDFIVGTVDQVLLLALKQKHLALRHLGLSKKVVVIDEVHAYDAYMSQYLEEALTWLATYGVPVILLSATLPAGQRRKLVQAYLKGKGAKSALPDSAFTSRADAYPLITYTDGDSVLQKDDLAVASKHEVLVRRIEEEDLIPTIKKLMDAGGNIGVVVNTVKRAQALARTCRDLFAEDEVLVLHSAFIATGRMAKEQDLLARIGKGADRPSRQLVIGTQVIEQSLDIDFDVMITDLAPIDLLLQRLGRLHRHHIDRPAAYRDPTLYVVGTSDRFDFEPGASAVYGDYLLIRSQYFLPERIQIPEDISSLVQKVYGEEDVEIEEILINKYVDKKEKHGNIIDKKSEKAKGFRIQDPVLKPTRRRSASLIGWVKNALPNDNEVRAQAQVRDSDESIEVIAVKGLGGGYGLFSENQDISGLIDDPKVAKRLAVNTLRLPRALCYPGLIDKTIEELEAYNRTYLPDWQKTAWLKGALGLVFDDKGQVELSGYRLTYSEDLGLEYERM
ncbi:CRISPR-associated helicase Cas3' [Peptococcus simiae]|uniref:CRISPR-associated helicase Cas3 n=1 Tax=Peptococcus simiae TaxID=1643805 RepID=A0ABW9GY63_9FIRM